MKVTYKCGCMAVQTEIDVPDRRPVTDIGDWMEMVQKNIGFDHAQISPMCRNQALEYARFPIEGDIIGAAPTKQ